MAHSGLLCVASLPGLPSMTTQDANKIRMLWVTEKEFDVELDAATCIEMVACLQETCAIQMLADYRHKDVQPKAFYNKIVYYHSSKIRYLKRFTRYISQCRVFHSMLESFQPNVVLIESGSPLLLKYAVSMRRKHNLRLIYDVRTLPVDSRALRNWINRKLLVSCLRDAAKHFDGITYITNQMRQYCIEKYRLPPHRSAVWTSGVNTELFSPSGRDSPSGPFTILYHGSIAKQRRIDNAIKAMSLLTDLDIRFVLLGKGDGLDDLKQLVDQLGIQKRVSFHEPVRYEEVPEWIHRCDAGILPLPDWDGWNVSSPIKLFEYLACAKPIIVTDIPAHRHVLEDRAFAFWAKQSSPQDIAEAIRQAYERRADFQHVGLKARQFVLDEYTWAKQAQKLYGFLGRLVPRHLP
jgi:glycosyltransferase involved in cell wall biosynthesis